MRPLLRGDIFGLSGRYSMGPIVPPVVLDLNASTPAIRLALIVDVRTVGF